MKPALLTLLALVLAVWLASPSGAALVCDTRARISLWLTVRGEVLVARALEQRRRIVTWHVDADGDWSMVATDGAGRSCIVAWGTAWRDLRKRARRSDPHRPSGKATVVAETEE